MSRLVTIVGAAELLHISPRTARTMAREGRLPAKKIGRQWLFDPERLLALVNEQEPPTLRVELREPFRSFLVTSEAVYKVGCGDDG